MAAGLEMLAVIRRAQIELLYVEAKFCDALRLRLRPLSPIRGCCLVLWRRCCFRVSSQLMFQQMLMIDTVAGGER